MVLGFAKLSLLTTEIFCKPRANVLIEEFLVKIKESIEANADADRVWSVVSDLDSEPDFWWGTKSARNISREGNILNREIVQNFGDHVISQKVTFRPKEEIEVQYLKGVTEGTKLLKIEKLSNNRQLVTAAWDIHFHGIYALTTFFVARHVRKGTVDALGRIKQACEIVTDVNIESK